MNLSTLRPRDPHRSRRIARKLRRRHIAGQFLLESTGIGLFGGIMGASIGVLVVVAVSASNNWTPVLDPLVPLGSPLLGAIVGLAAGLYPAWRASRLEPAESLRATNA